GPFIRRFDNAVRRARNFRRCGSLTHRRYCSQSRAIPSSSSRLMSATPDLLRVLVVDDEAPTRRKLLRLLPIESYVALVGYADNAEAAISSIEKHQPDLVFIDVQMPGADGFDVVRAISANCDSRGSAISAPRFVFITAHDHYAVRAFEVHAFDYLLKPVAED